MSPVRNSETRVIPTRCLSTSCTQNFTPLESRIVGLLGMDATTAWRSSARTPSWRRSTEKTDVKPAVDRLVDQRKVDQVSTGRSYADRVLRLAAQQLF